jgi:hypothetical protein
MKNLLLTELRGLQRSLGRSNSVLEKEVKDFCLDLVPVLLNILRIEDELRPGPDTGGQLRGYPWITKDVVMIRDKKFPIDERNFLTIYMTFRANHNLFDGGLADGTLTFGIAHTRRVLGFLGSETDLLSCQATISYQHLGKKKYKSSCWIYQAELVSKKVGKETTAEVLQTKAIPAIERGYKALNEELYSHLEELKQQIKSSKEHPKLRLNLGEDTSDTESAFLDMLKENY